MPSLPPAPSPHTPGRPPFEVDPTEMEPLAFQQLVEAYLVEHNLRGLEVPIEDCGEPLACLTDIPHLWMPQDIPGQVSDPAEIPPLARNGLVEKLRRIQKKLIPKGLGLKVFYALRPIHVQEKLQESAKARVRSERPDLVKAGDEQEIERLSYKYVAPTELAPHCTGAAVDLCIYELNSGEELDYGTGFPDFVPETMTEHPSITGQARKNRLELRDLMAEEGLWNYPGEWWHFCYGDRGWAGFTGNSPAIYGPVKEAARR